VIRIDTLPAAQRRFWEQDAPQLPTHWVLYGGTGIALQLGHRSSVDFDFFSSDPLDRAALRRSCAAVRQAKTIQDEPDTLSVIADVHGDPVKISFFGGIDFGRVGDPVAFGGRLTASLLDLFGTKLATITQRIESRDYIDIAALLRAGLDINQGVGALLALYGNQASGLQSVKSMVWFGDGDLDRALPADVKEVLRGAAAQYDARTGPLPKRSPRLD
jgi:hypothetical protein